MSIVAVEVALIAVDHGNQFGLPVFFQEAVTNANLDAVPHPREKGLERIGLKPVVGVNEHDIRTSRAGEPVVPGDGDARVLLIDKRDARIRLGPSSASLSGVVARSIVDEDHLPVREGLAEDAADAVVDVAADVVDGNYYAYGSWQIIPPQSRGLSHSFWRRRSRRRGDPRKVSGLRVAHQGAPHAPELGCPVLAPSVLTVPPLGF